MTLLIMAAGMGSRFGGLKQLEPVGPNGEFIIDYSIYDAIRAGFERVVFIIKEENYEIFKDTIGKRIEDKIRVEYVFQDINELPEGFSCPEGREKPWGTAHAILAAKNIIKESFGIINADDFYGLDAYEKLAEFLKGIENNNSSEFAVIGYPVSKTLSNGGSVKRGIMLEDDENNILIDLCESLIEYKDNQLIATPLLGGDSFVVSDYALVSMNMFGFTPEIFKYLSIGFKTFLKENDLLTAEFLLPEFLNTSLTKLWNVKIIRTDANWYGITYREDKEMIVKAINDYIKQGIYPEELWR